MSSPGNLPHQPVDQLRGGALLRSSTWQSAPRTTSRTTSRTGTCTSRSESAARSAGGGDQGSGGPSAGIGGDLTAARPGAAAARAGAGSTIPRARRGREGTGPGDAGGVEPHRRFGRYTLTCRSRCGPRSGRSAELAAPCAVEHHGEVNERDHGDGDGNPADDRQV